MTKVLPRKIYYTLNSGKNSKLKYFIASILRSNTPRCMLRPFLNYKMGGLDKRADKDYILDRVSYYCKLTGEMQYDKKLWYDKSVTLNMQALTSPKVYYYDSMRYARWFDGRLRWVLVPKDLSRNMDIPSIVKSRLIGEGNECSVLLKLNAVRHFIFVNDNKRWKDKKDMAVFRGGIGQNRRLMKRKPFVERYFGNPMFDIGVLEPQYGEWRRPKMTISEHLDYKFVMSLEGNDVASNLKWIMSSNSIAVMPKPECETWFMEGRLIPDYHYIEIKPDFSDVEEKLRYYISHPDKAYEIIRHAHEWVDQFRDTRRETLISLLVLDKYFKITNG